MLVSDKLENILVALHKVQEEMPNVLCKSVNGGFKSKYADIDSILNTIKPVLSKHGLLVIQEVTTDSERWFCGVTTRLFHVSGEYISFDRLDVAVDKAKQNAHGIGSAITYARRYSLTAALCIAEEDDDGNGASGVKNEPVQSEEIPMNVLLDTVESLIKEKGKVLKTILDHFKVKELKEISRGDLEKLMRNLIAAK